MDEIKVNMVKFLMTMFETSSDNSGSVRMFKANVEELVRRNQIPNSVKNLIYNMYGIANTDTFKPNAQSNKLMQINMLMMQIDNMIKTGHISELSKFRNNIENGVKQGNILKSARDIVFEIYGWDSVKPSVNSSFKIGQNNNIKSQNLGPVIDVDTSSKNSKKKSKEVQQDIAQFKSQYVPEIYYEYPNPNYDGCSGSSMEKHIKLIESTERPIKAKFVIYKMIADDGCHQTWRYIDVPKEYYKPITTKNPYPTTSIKTPTTGSAVGCTGSIFSNRHC